MKTPVQLWIAGATGLVGQQVAQLAEQQLGFAGIHALVREVGKLSVANHGNRLHEHAVQFAHLHEAAQSASLPACDAAICTLGTTIKIAGSQSAFRAVDFDAVLRFAVAAKVRGARHFGVVSSLGAAADSSVFYSRVKGEMEAAIQALGFESLLIVRPSMLSGEREEFRIGEQISLALMRPLRFAIPKKYRAISAAAVASALIDYALRQPVGCTILESDALQRYAA